MRAELGCERYLASTVVTGLGQRGSTFLAKLRCNSVFVLALRAFHCRPRREKRASFTRIIMSSMVDASRAASGHATAAPPTSGMNWRRLWSSMGSSPEPAVPAYRRLRLHRKRPQVLGVDLNCSESRIAETMLLSRYAHVFPILPCTTSAVVVTAMTVTPLLGDGGEGQPMLPLLVRVAVPPPTRTEDNAGGT